MDSIFRLFSLGVATNRDEWIYDFNSVILKTKVQRFISNYNSELTRFMNEQFDGDIDIDSFVNNDPSFIK